MGRYRYILLITAATARVQRKNWKKGVRLYITLLIDDIEIEIEIGRVDRHPELLAFCTLQSYNNRNNIPFLSLSEFTPLLIFFPQVMSS